MFGGKHVLAIPDEIKKTQYYFPTENGQEKNLKERLQSIWKGFKEYYKKKN